uniref:Uncharacterized protein n=1 Tax=Rangifer tarandus platyrhynchus TaxID=3082113 RepID=A0ACB0E5P8_RANTA|nr:unnamed protein product [Rangifer tarandus platyrhynchus]
MLPRARSPVGDVGAPGARPEEGAASSSWNVGGPASGVDAGRSRGRSGKRPGSADHTVALGTAIQGLRGRFPPQSGFRAEGESARFRAGVGAPTAWGEATRSGEGWMPPTAWGRLPSGQLAVSVPVLWRRGPCRGFPAGALTPPLWFPQMASLRLRTDLEHPPLTLKAGEGAIKRGRSHPGGLRGDAGSQALRACCLPAPPDKPRGMAPAAFHTEGERAGTLFSPHIPVEAAGERGQEGEECLKHNQNPKPTFTGPTVRPPPGPSGPCPCRHRSAKPGCRLARAPNATLLRPVPCQARLQVLYASCCAHPPPFSIHCAVNGHWRCVQSGASDTDAAVVCRVHASEWHRGSPCAPERGLSGDSRSSSYNCSTLGPSLTLLFHFSHPRVKQKFWILV